MNQTATSIRAITPQDLAGLGLNDLAYIKPMATAAGTLFGVFAANGAAIGTFDNEAVAIAACRQHDMEPLRVH